MREIKFRAWDSFIDEMSYFDLEHLYWDGIAHCEIMQFTGLLDKNGKEIYEGDVLTYDSADHKTPYPEERKMLPCYVVKFEEQNSFILGGFGITEARLYCHSFRFKHTEVIGNIYENPELLNSNALNKPPSCLNGWYC